MPPSPPPPTRRISLNDTPDVDVLHWPHLLDAMQFHTDKYLWLEQFRDRLGDPDAGRFRPRAYRAVSRRLRQQGELLLLFLELLSHMLYVAPQPAALLRKVPVSEPVLWDRGFMPVRVRRGDDFAPFERRRLR